MRRGTRVGQAYVAITADGSGINEDIADSFDAVDYDRLGEKAGAKFRDRIRENLEGIDKDFDGVIDRMGKSFENNRALEQGVARTVAKAFDSGKLTPLVAEVGERLGDEFAFGFDREITRSVIDSVQNALDKAAKSGNGLRFSDFIDDTGAYGVDLPSGTLDEVIKNVRATIDQTTKEYEAQNKTLLSLEAKGIADRAKIRMADVQAAFAEQDAVTKYFATEEQQRVKDASNAANLRVKQVQFEMAEKIKARQDYQNIWESLLDEREEGVYNDAVAARDERNFLRFTELAKQRLQTIKISPTLDEAATRKVQRDLRDSLERKEQLTLELNATVPERERDKIKQQIEQIDATIQANVELAENGPGGRGVSRNRSIGDRVGRMFGAGSRSNVLNVLGKSMGGLINLSDKLRRGATGLFNTFAKGFSQAADGANLAQKAMSGFAEVGAKGGALASRAMAALASSGPAAIVAIAVVAAALVALVSVLSALVGIATAFVATIGAGLVAAATVGAGALLSVVAAGGLLTAAFMSMTDAQKKLLSTAFTPLRDMMTGIGQIMIQQMVPAFQTWSSNLQNALFLLEPVARVMGAAFADAGNILTEAFSGPGFQAFAVALGTYLPGIVRSLSTALGGFLNGLLGLFSAVMPYVSQFADYLARTATEFSNWANSASGQNSISDFVGRAVESLKSLWNAVSEIGGFLKDVLFSPEAMEAGNDIFDGITKTFEGFRESIAQAAADGSLKQFFDDAVRFGSTLWDVIEGLFNIFSSLYSSGVLTAIGDAFIAFAYGADAAAWAIDALGDSGVALPGILTAVLGPLGLIISAVNQFSNAVEWALGKIRSVETVKVNGLLSSAIGTGNAKNAIGAGIGGGKSGVIKSTASMNSIINSGRNARGKTSGGGSKSGAAPAYVNPYEAYANSIMIAAETTAKKVAKAVTKSFADMNTAIRESLKLDSADAALDSLLNTRNQIVDASEAMVTMAENALNTAAQRLASASNANEANAALAAVRAAQNDLSSAYHRRQQMYDAANALWAQGLSDEKRVTALVDGLKVQNATLADFAEARGRVAEKIVKANEKLTEAIRLRDDYRQQVADSIRAFGDLTSAEVQTVNGVEQALTATDITSNLEDRLNKIRSFQDNLRMLLAMGLSNDAYKQILDAGVDGGSAYASALLSGGIGAVQQVNGLIDQIGGAADQLGLESSNRMYQAGVDAAQGLVDGLNSLSGQLDSAAARLGEAISASLKKSLGIQSPSRVMIAAMDDVGDGAVIGLGNQHQKVGTAASSLAAQIAVSPQSAAAAAASRAEAGTVSGNNETGQKFRDLVVVTPTENPKAVAYEVLNEVVEVL